MTISTNNPSTKNNIILFPSIGNPLYVKINGVMHSSGIPTGDRIILFSTFLMACLFEDFQDVLSKGKNLSPKEMSSYINECSSVVQDCLFGGVNVRFQAVTNNEQNAVLNTLDLLVKHFGGTSFVPHLLSNKNLISDIYEIFNSYSGGNDTGKYFTPPHASEFTVKVIASLRGKPYSQDDVFYDPTCGVGGFLTGHCPNSKVFGTEYTDSIAMVARLNVYLHGSHPHIVQGSSLPKDYSPAVSAIETLFSIENVRPNVVLMNPPFPSKESDFKSFEFIEHALDVAAEGAYIAAIVPTSVALKEDKVHVAFRKNALRRAQLKAIITLPPDLFQPKASVNTILIVLEKKSCGHETMSEVLFSRCVNDGFDLDRSTKMRIPKEAKKKRLVTEDNKKPREDFAAFLEEWLPAYRADGTLNIPRKFTAAKLTMADKYDGTEWTPERFLTDQVEFEDIFRLAKRVQAEMLAGENLREVGGKW